MLHYNTGRHLNHPDSLQLLGVSLLLVVRATSRETEAEKDGIRENTKKRAGVAALSKSIGMFPAEQRNSPQH